MLSSNDYTIIFGKNMVLVDYIGIFLTCANTFGHINIYVVVFFVCIKSYKNHSYKHNEQINNQNIDKTECFGVKFVKIYPEMAPQKIWFWLII
jgi:hypothetical protein